MESLIKKVVSDLYKLDDHENHYEIFYENRWYDLVFDFFRETGFEIGGEKDEKLPYRRIDKIEVQRIYIFTKDGEELEPDWQLAKAIQDKYNS